VLGFIEIAPFKSQIAEQFQGLSRSLATKGVVDYLPQKGNVAHLRGPIKLLLCRALAAAAKGLPGWGSRRANALMHKPTSLHKALAQAHGFGIDGNQIVAMYSEEFQVLVNGLEPALIGSKAVSSRQPRSNFADYPWKLNLVDEWTHLLLSL
jgi:hypothetical protein